MPTASQAAEVDRAEAEGRLLTGDAGALNLNTVAELDGAYFADASNPGAGFENIDASVLSGLVDAEVGVPLFGTEGLIELGALEQYGRSETGGVPFASSGAVTESGAIDIAAVDDPAQQASVNLTPLLDRAGLSALLDEASLELGAVSGLATVDDEGSYVGDYQIGDGTLTLTSPATEATVTSLNGLVGDVSTDVNAITAEGGVIDDAVAPSLAAIRNTVNSALQPVPILPPLGEVEELDVTATLDLDLETALANVLSQPIGEEENGVTINLSTGEIVVDLAAMVTSGTLDDLPPNTELLDAETIEAINTEIAAVLDTVPALVVDTVNDALNSADLTIAITGDVTLAGLPVADLAITLDGTLGGFTGAEGAEEPTTAVALDLAGLNLSALTNALAPLLTGILDNLTSPLLEAVTGAGLAETAVTPVVDTLATALDPVIDGVATSLLAVTVNVQETPGDFVDPRGEDADSFTQSALSIALLPGDPLVDIDLASATVKLAAPDDDDDANASASAAASAAADSDANAASEAAAQAAADPDSDDNTDATAAATAAADADASAAAEAAAQ
ncbi:choice-of-anchor G family protein, partial [Desertihabitans aurantiacus]|uniref:choice-of-anchor G family protein n=1 Tax=Desertihabitans aurantiacus TaxID=2282477 RepID=UPI0018E54C87